MSKKDEFSILNRSANNDGEDGTEKKKDSTQKIYFIAVVIFAAMYIGFKFFG